MGLIIGRRNFTLTAPMWKFYINLSIVTCYFVGALIGGYPIKDLEDNQLIINMCLYGVIIILYFMFVKKEKEYRCCLTALGISTNLEEEYNCNAAQSAVVSQSEDIGDKVIEDKPFSVTTPVSGPIIAAADDIDVDVEDEVVDSDEEEDEEEPLDNQITEEDMADMENLRHEEGEVVGETTTSNHSRDVESDDLGSIQLITAVEDKDKDEDEDEDEEAAVTLVEASPTPTPPSTPAPMKEMEHFWSFRVMMLVVCLLCFNAAFINATTKLSSKEIFTSHITGELVA